MDKKKLNAARSKIDRVDNDLFKIIKKRTLIVNHMLSLKKNKKEIIDHKRINQILRKVKMKSRKNNIDPKLTTKIWKSMIWSYVDYQKMKFRKK